MSEWKYATSVDSTGGRPRAGLRQGPGQAGRVAGADGKKRRDHDGHAEPEPNYESGKAEKWAIGMADDAPFCVAGLWRAWEEENGSFSFSFTQITVNAEEHPLMKRFHKPGQEKRSLVIVPREEYGAWLNCRDPEGARSMLNLFPSELMKAWPAAKGYGGKQQQATLL